PAFFPGGHHFLFYRLTAGHGGGIPFHQPHLAFYRFHRGALAPHHVWHHLLLPVGRHVCSVAKNNRQGSPPGNGGRTFLAGIGRPPVLYHPPDDRLHPARTNVDRRKTLY